jgi:hypothetical protein
MSGLSLIEYDGALPQVPNTIQLNWQLCLLHSSRGSTERTESQTEAVSHYSNDDANPSHLQT